MASSKKEMGHVFSRSDGDLKSSKDKTGSGQATAEKLRAASARLDALANQAHSMQLRQQQETVTGTLMEVLSAGSILFADVEDIYEQIKAELKIVHDQTEEQGRAHREEATGNQAIIAQLKKEIEADRKKYEEILKAMQDAQNQSNAQQKQDNAQQLVAWKALFGEMQEKYQGIFTKLEEQLKQEREGFEERSVAERKTFEDKLTAEREAFERRLETEQKDRTDQSTKERKTFEDKLTAEREAFEERTNQREADHAALLAKQWEASQTVLKEQSNMIQKQSGMIAQLQQESIERSIRDKAGNVFAMLSYISLVLLCKIQYDKSWFESGLISGAGIAAANMAGRILSPVLDWTYDNVIVPPVRCLTFPFRWCYSKCCKKKKPSKEAQYNVTPSKTPSPDNSSPNSTAPLISTPLSVSMVGDRKDSFALETKREQNGQADAQVNDQAGQVDKLTVLNAQLKPSRASSAPLSASPPQGQTTLRFMNQANQSNGGNAKVGNLEVKESELSVSVTVAPTPVHKKKSSLERQQEEPDAESHNEPNNFHDDSPSHVHDHDDSLRHRSSRPSSMRAATTPFPPQSKPSAGALSLPTTPARNKRVQSN